MSQDHQTLRRDVEEFLRARSMSAVTFGRSALNDPHLVRDLRNGRRLWPETEARVRAFMRDAVEQSTAPAVAA